VTSNYIVSNVISRFLIFQLLCKDPVDWLGCVEDTQPIREHHIFTGLNWYLLENKKLPPPFKPILVSL